MTTTIAITNLETNEFKYYDICSIKDYDNAINNYFKWNNDSDFEIQIVESDYNITEKNLIQTLELFNERSEDKDLISEIYNYYGNKRDSLEVLNNQLYHITHADNEVEAIENYITDLSLLEIPEHLESYIDWDSIFRDYKCDGYTILEMSDNKWMIIQPW